MKASSITAVKILRKTRIISGKSVTLTSQQSQTSYPGSSGILWFPPPPGTVQPYDKKKQTAQRAKGRDFQLFT